MSKFSNLFRGITCVATFLLIIMIFGGTVLEENRIMVDQTLGTKSNLIISEEDDASLFTSYKPDEDQLTSEGKLDYDKWVNKHVEIAEALQEEGTVLLTNKNNALPLAETAKVTVFGLRGKNLVSGFEQAGLVCNDVVKNVYNGLTGSSPSPSYANNKNYALYDCNEKGPADLLAKNDSYQNSFTNFNDAAIVVFGRSNAEGADYKKGEAGVKPETEARNSLAMHKNEKELFDLARAKFNKVIVIIQTVSQMEVEYYKQNADAVLYAGLTGVNGPLAIGKILNGKSNPSGGLYDIYSTHSESSPASVNVGLYEYANKEDIKFIQDSTLSGRSAKATKEKVLALKAKRDELGGGRIDTSSIGTGGTDFGFYNYVVEAEGLYVGYRYYETRYYDCVMGNTEAKSTAGVKDSKAGWKYNEEVSYSFGAGLSYTTFDVSVGDINWTTTKHEKLATFDVTVKNTGNRDGKKIIQVYSQSPYTEYDKTNHVEKSAVQLVTFEKTKLLKPGEEQKVKITVDLQDVASYDYKNKKTYIMESSDNYFFAIGDGAHDAVNNILAFNNKTTADGMDYNGNKNLVIKWSYSSAVDGDIDDFTFAFSKTGEKITNQLDFSTWDYYETGKVTELTRSHWQTTWPKEYTNMVANEKLLNHLDGNYFTVHDKNNPDDQSKLDAIKFGVETDLKFADFKNAEFNDYRWDELIDSMTLEETILYAIESGRGFADIASIGFPTGSYSENAPTPIWFNPNSPEIQAPWLITKPAQTKSTSWPTLAVMACTFSRELNYAYGRQIGNDALLNEKPMMWLPGANTHRTPQGGRASQYYCEDPILTGICTMEAAMGCMEKGGIVTAKHFAFNDQEAGRSGVAPFINEQRAREVELRAFQIAFEANKYDRLYGKDTGMQGVMTSFSKIGGVECQACKGLLTNILRKEWGFNGYHVSDLKDDLDIMPQNFLAGGTGSDWRTFDVDVEPYVDPEEYKYDAEVLLALKDACKRKLWVFSHTPLVNKVNKSTHTVWNMTWWRATYISGIVGFGVLTVAGATLYTISLLLKKKEG